MAKRVYDVWKGSNKLILGDRLIFGPDARSLIITLTLVIVPVIIFCIFVAWHLRHEFDLYNARYAVTAVAICFTIYVSVLLYLTSARDPGIIPRNPHPPEEVLLYDSSTSVEIGGRQTPSLQFPRTKDVMHNYRFFFMFVSLSTLLCIYVFTMSAYYIKVLMRENKGTVWKATKDSPAYVVLMAYCFISLWFVGGLTAFHLYLRGSNQTTYENFRYRTDNRFNVYSRGCIGNFLDVFCTEVQLSKYNFRTFVQEGIQRSVLHSEREGDLEDVSDNPRSKVQDDLDIGEDLLKISQRRNVELEQDLAGRGSNGRSQAALEVDSPISSSRRAPTIRSENRHAGSMRSGSWEIAPDVLSNSTVTESRN